MKTHKKVVLITGAGAGIGKALAIKFAQQQCRLILCDYNELTLRQVASECQSVLADEYAQQLLMTVLDTSDRQAVEQLAEKVEQQFGKLDILINNAGVSMGEVSVNDLDYDDLERVMQINFYGMVYFTKAFLPLLDTKSNSQGSALVNVSSIFGLIGSKFSSAYVASKFAIYGFSQVLRFELLDQNVHIHTVHPAGIKTDISKNALKKELRNPKFEKNLSIAPEQAADIIVSGIEKNKERILIGKEAYFVDWASRLLPVLGGKIINKYFIKR